MPSKEQVQKLGAKLAAFLMFSIGGFECHISQEVYSLKAYLASRLNSCVYFLPRIIERMAEIVSFSCRKVGFLFHICAVLLLARSVLVGEQSGTH